MQTEHITIDEYENARYQMLKTHNLLTELEAKLGGHTRLSHYINEVRFNLSQVLDELKTTNIIK